MKWGEKKHEAQHIGSHGESAQHHSKGKLDGLQHVNRSSCRSSCKIMQTTSEGDANSRHACTA